MRILITGCAGFIGYHLSTKLLQDKKNKVFGIDNMNHYYIVLEEYPCSCREALLKREQYWMDEASKMSDFILTNFNRCWGRDYEFDDNIPNNTLQKVLDDKLISLKKQ